MACSVFAEGAGTTPWGWPQPCNRATPTTVAATASPPCRRGRAGPLEAVIGLETHVQLGTVSEIFTAASTAFGDAPSNHADPVVLGLPGTLLVPNTKVLEDVVKAAMGWP